MQTNRLKAYYRVFIAAYVMYLARGRLHASKGVSIGTDSVRSPCHAQMGRLPLWLGPQGLKEPPEHAREHRWAGLARQTHQGLQSTGTAPVKDSPGASTASSAERRDGRESVQATSN